jgi:uncharacterized protein (DUF486 family)
MKLILVPLMLSLSASMMAFAWIGHLRWEKTWSFWVALGFSWLIVLPEYVLNVSATRWGKGVFSGAQMASIHLCAGVVFVTLVSHRFLREPIQMRQMIGFALMAVSLVLVMYRGGGAVAS